MKTRRILTFVVTSLVLPLTARAEKDRFDVGEAVKNFTLKAINADEAGQPYVGIDQFCGPSAKEPKKAVVLSFFATYCEPCKREIPFLSALYDLYRDKGLMILMVSIDKEADKVEVAQDLAKKADVKFPVLTDRFNIVAKRYFISKLPCVYLVDAEGKVSMVNIGYNEDISKQLLERIRRAVGEPTSDPIPERLASLMGEHEGPAAIDVKPEEAVAPAGGGGDEEAAEVSEDAGAAKAKGKVKARNRSKGRKGRKKKGR